MVDRDTYFATALRVTVVSAMALCAGSKAEGVIRHCLEIELLSAFRIFIFGVHREEWVPWSRVMVRNRVVIRLLMVCDLWKFSIFSPLESDWKFRYFCPSEYDWKFCNFVHHKVTGKFSILSV